jgi:hypothetical protein
VNRQFWHALQRHFLFAPEPEHWQTWVLRLAQTTDVIAPTQLVPFSCASSSVFSEPSSVGAFSATLDSTAHPAATVSASVARMAMRRAIEEDIVTPFVRSTERASLRRRRVLVSDLCSAYAQVRQQLTSADPAANMRNARRTAQTPSPVDVTQLLDPTHEAADSAFNTFGDARESRLCPETQSEAKV